MQKNVIVYLAVIVPLLLGPALATTSSGHYRFDTDYVPICYRKHGVLVPMRGSCSGFFICVEGNAIASSCGSFYRFNRRTRHCDHPANVDCKHLPPTIEVDASDSYVPIMPMLPVLPTASASASPSPLSLPSPSVDLPPPSFAEHFPKPQHPDEVVADEMAGDICHRKRNGVLLPKLDSCTQFYVCLLQRPYRRTCPPMLHFNAERRLCQDPALAQCVAAAKPEQSSLLLELADFGGGVACKGIPNGILLPHDDGDCTKFYNCQNEQRNEMECPSGLHFSVRHQRCEWPNLARCSV